MEKNSSIDHVPRPSAVLIDIGDTLLKEEGYDLAPGLRLLKPTVSEETLLEEINYHIFRAHQTDNNEFSLRDWLDDHLELFASDCNASEMEQKIWEVSVLLSPLPGVKSTLDYLNDSGVPLGCISNAIFSADILEAELSKHGLSSHLKFVLSSADFGKKKPSREIFLRALSLLQVEPKDTWYIGDSWENDILGAANAGMFPVWFSKKTNEEVKPNRQQVKSWTEIQEIASLALSEGD